MNPTRETFGNIPNSSQLIFYCLTVVTMAAFAYGIWRKKVCHSFAERLTRQGIARLKFSGRKRYGVKTQTKLSLT